MSPKIKKMCKYPVLFSIGGLVYYLIEIVYRGYSHWTMIILGGLCFILCGLINEKFTWDMPMWKQQTICSGVITCLEFSFGVQVNIILKLNVWNYSNLPFNILGQVCLSFSTMWFFLSTAAIILDDYQRYWLFNEEKPQYKWW